MASTLDNANSGIHQLPSNCYPPSESDDEDSFVVLNNSLGPDTYTDRIILNAEPISTQTIQASLDSIAEILQQNVMESSSISHSSTEISTEIQKKIDNLIEENVKLKDILAQNNLAMKKQVDTITEWQKEVQRVQESHKEKFNDMKKYITILKTENDELKNAMLERSATSSVEEGTKKAKDMLVKQPDNIKQFELEAAQKKVKELEKALDILSFEKEDLGKRMVEKEQELNDLTADKDLLLYKLDLSKQKEKKQNANANEVAMLKEVIIALRDNHNNFIDQISKLNNQNEVLKADIVEKEQHFGDTHNRLLICEQDLSKTKQQLMASQMHITELKEFHVRTSSESDKKIESLLSQIKDFKIETDENAALRAQLDLYKSDFEMERTQRKELFEEKNKIANDLQQLQRRNNQLLEEIDQLKYDFIYVNKDEARAAPSNSPPSPKHICPICTSKFTSVRLLEDHVGYCLANTGN